VETDCGHGVLLDWVLLPSIIPEPVGSPPPWTTLV
jgi:hypothetical protein